MSASDKKASVSLPARQTRGPRLLDLFCGAGGASAGYHAAGFSEIVGVDIDPQPNYPFWFVQADALNVEVRDFDFVHASPPCQSFTAYRRKGHGVGDGYLNLIPQTRTLLEAAGVPFAIENVEQARAELREPIRLCGSSFKLDVRRHRLFEFGGVEAPDPPACDHGWQTPRFPCATNRKKLRRTVEVGAYRCARLAPDAMGIHWMTNDELSQAIPPAYTKWIGEFVLSLLEAT